MGGPAGVGETERSAHRFLLQAIRQRLNLADRAHPMQPVVAAIHGYDAGRIVATVFQPPQSFEQDGRDVAFGDGAHNSTHGDFQPGL